MPDHVYLYPEYFRKGDSRADGRRVPSDLAQAEVTTDTLLAAAKALGFTAEAEPSKHYPRQFYRYGGRVKIAKRAGVTKTKLLRLVAEELQKHPAPGAVP